MEIIISTRHGSLNEATRTKVKEKVAKLPRFFDRLTSIGVIIDLKESESPQVDIKASAEHTQDFVASVKAESLWGAVDGAVHKLEQQLRKTKQRHRNPEVRRQEAPSDGESGLDASAAGLE